MKCKAEGCCNDKYQNGFCSKHYQQIIKYGRLTPELEKFVWTKEREKYLADNYSKLGLKKIAKELGASESSIKCKAKRMGVRARSLSEQERRMLDEKLYLCNSELMKLGYTKRQIDYHRGVYGATVIESNDELHVAEIARLVNKPSHSIARIWIKSRGLRSHKNGCYRMVSYKNLFKFMEKNPDLWDATKCDRYFFGDQKWFKEKLKKDSLEKRKERWGEWYEVV